MLPAFRKDLLHVVTMRYFQVLGTVAGVQLAWIAYELHVIADSSGSVSVSGDVDAEVTTSRRSPLQMQIER
jgi:hypothetical protein